MQPESKEGVKDISVWGHREWWYESESTKHVGSATGVRDGEQQKPGVAQTGEAGGGQEPTDGLRRHSNQEGSGLWAKLRGLQKMILNNPQQFQPVFYWRRSWYIPHIRLSKTDGAEMRSGQHAPHAQPSTDSLNSTVWHIEPEINIQL